MQTHNKKVRKKRICAKIYIGNAKKAHTSPSGRGLFPLPGINYQGRTRPYAHNV